MLSVGVVSSLLYNRLLCLDTTTTDISLDDHRVVRLVSGYEGGSISKVLSLIQKSTVVSLDRYIFTQFNMQLKIIVLSSLLIAVVRFRVQFQPAFCP